MRDLPLTKGMVALVDDEDYERLSLYKWCASLDSRGTKWYAKRWCRKDEKELWRTKLIRLHHFVLDIVPWRDLSPGHVVDHINHNSLDCRKENLEIITQEENMRRSLGWRKKGIKALDHILLPDF